MRTKIPTLLSMSILALLLFVGFASAVVTHTETFDNSGLTGNYLDGSFVGNDDITWNYLQARDQGDYAINGAGMIFRDTTGKIYSNTLLGIEDFSIKLKKGSASSGNRQVELFINGVSKGLSEEFDDDITHTFTVNDLNITGNVVLEIRNTKEVHVVIDDITWTEFSEPTQEEPEEITACTLIGNPNDNLRIRSIDFTNNGFSEKEFGSDDEWFPLDNIEVEIKVENNGNDKIKDIEVQWGLYNTDTNEWVIDLDDEKDFDLKEDKDETLTISFKLDDKLDVDMEDLVDGENYKFYVIADGIDTGDNDREVCTSDYEPVSIIIESDFVVLDNIQFQDTVSCGSDVQLTADVWNIGDEDQEDVSVRVYNDELGIDQMVEIGDVNAFDNEPLNVPITIPEDAEEKTYALKFTVYSDNDVYVNDFGDDESEFDKLFVIEGSCGVVTQNVLVKAELESGGIAGEELVVKAIITNLGDELTTFTLNAAEYSEWASSVDLDQSTILVGAGESKDVLFTFNVKGDVKTGDYTFDIEVLSDNQIVETQPVSVTIEGAEEGEAGFLTGNIINENNWYLWGIGILNIILVIVIIAVAVRVARK